MDHHVVENAAGNLHIRYRGRLRVARRDLDDIHFADLAIAYHVVYCTVVVIEAAAEADLQFDACLLGGIDGCMYLGQIVVNRLFAEDTPEHLEKSLLSTGEIMLTAEASQKDAEKILSGIEHITDIQIEMQDTGMVTIQVKTDQQDIYALSRSVFFAVAEREKALLEVNLKKANLEDIFIELTEDKTASIAPVENRVEVEPVESEEDAE